MVRCLSHQSGSKTVTGEVLENMTHDPLDQANSGAIKNKGVGGADIQV